MLNDAFPQLVEPIGKPIEASDSLIPSLCAFLLGTCYEFNREPGEITRWVNFRHQNWRELTGLQSDDPPDYHQTGC